MFRLLKRVLFKTLTGPLKYGRKNGYDAARYWGDRFARYGGSLRGAGHEGISEEANEEMYREAARVFTDLCRQQGVDFPKARVLDIGCGTGFYAQLLRDLGVRQYTGLDVADVLLPELAARFPEYEFKRGDITEEKVEGEFDLVLMIDVIEHIVEESRFSRAMENVKSCMSDRGVFIVSGMRDVSKKHLFYLRWWSVEDVKRRFPEFQYSAPMPFRDCYVLAVANPSP
jgi:SAM-dependent methyltransferase